MQVFDELPVIKESILEKCNHGTLCGRDHGVELSIDAHIGILTRKGFTNELLLCYTPNIAP